MDSGRGAESAIDGRARKSSSFAAACSRRSRTLSARSGSAAARILSRSAGSASSTCRSSSNRRLSRASASSREVLMRSPHQALDGQTNAAGEVHRTFAECTLVRLAARRSAGGRTGGAHVQAASACRGSSEVSLREATVPKSRSGDDLVNTSLCGNFSAASALSGGLTCYSQVDRTAFL